LKTHVTHATITVNADYWGAPNFLGYEEEDRALDYNKEVFRRQYPVVYTFVQQLAYFRGLKAGLAGLTDYMDFWSCTLNNHLKQAAVDWCKVFGSPKEDIHWTKTPTASTIERARQDFEWLVFSRTDFTAEQWEHYCTSMRAMRDKYVAHVDLRKPLEGPVPLFDAALQVADAYWEWVRQVIQPVLMSPRRFRADYEMWKSEACIIASRYPHSLIASECTDVLLPRR